MSKIFTIDGIAPDGRFSPQSEAEAVEIVNSCAAKRDVLVPVGGGTALQTGNSLVASQWNSLSTENLNNVIDFSPEDMVVTIGAGTTMSNLRDTLRAEGQFLPIDCQSPDDATLGGIIASNYAGDWRPAFGTPRDRLLGLRVVLADSTVVRAGGKVVKNVAGYDLCKLFAGSWGTLGFITEATFKTNPIPAITKSLYFHSSSLSVAIEAALQVHCARLQPIGIKLMFEDNAVLKVVLMGSEESVDWQAKEVNFLLSQCGLLPTEGISEDDRHLPRIRAKISVMPSDLPSTLSVLQSQCKKMAAQIPTGIVDCDFLSETEFSSLNEHLRMALPPGSQLVWEELPPENKLNTDIWGTPRPEWKVMKQLKETMDPLNLFSPGRFVGRI